MVWLEIIKPIWHLPIGHKQQMVEVKAERLIKSGHAKKIKAPRVERVVEVAELKPAAETADIPVHTERTVGTVADTVEQVSTAKRPGRKSTRDKK